MIYDQNELKQAVEQGERKLAERRQRARRQKKRAKVALVVAGVALVAGGVLRLASRPVSAPRAPSLVVTWPQSKTPQVVTSGQAVLAREGQPLGVSLLGDEGWNVAWRSSGVENQGNSFDWAPQKNGDSLVAVCRAKGSGWLPHLSSALPSLQLSLLAAVPTTSDRYGRTLSAPKAVWVLPRVQASGAVGWDERSLSALSDAATALASPGSSLTNPTWQLVSDFDGKTQAPASGATYAALRADKLEAVMPQVGATLVRLAPAASIKWIVREDETPPQGIVRMSFDGKRARQAWIKRAGQGAGTPVTGWENGEWKGTVPPVAPTPTPASRQ